MTEKIVSPERVSQLEVAVQNEEALRTGWNTELKDELAALWQAFGTPL